MQRIARAETSDRPARCRFRQRRTPVNTPTNTGINCALTAHYGGRGFKLTAGAGPAPRHAAVHVHAWDVIFLAALSRDLRAEYPISLQLVTMVRDSLGDILVPTVPRCVPSVYDLGLGFGLVRRNILFHVVTPLVVT